MGDAYGAASTPTPKGAVFGIVARREDSNNRSRFADERPAGDIERRAMERSVSLSPLLP